MSEYFDEIPTFRPASREIPEAIPEDADGLRRLISKMIACPLTAKVSERFSRIEERLIELWLDTCCEYEIDSECRYVSYLYGGAEEVDFQLQEDDTDELRPAAIAMYGWIELARKEFLNRTRGFYAKMADSDDYAKHFSCAQRGRNELLQATRNTSISIFAPGIRAQDLDLLLANAFDEEWVFQAIADLSEPFRFAVDCQGEIGATGGAATGIVAVEVSVALIHAYPVAASECSSKGVPIVLDQDCLLPAAVRYR